MVRTNRTEDIRSCGNIEITRRNIARYRHSAGPQKFDDRTKLSQQTVTWSGIENILSNVQQRSQILQNPLSRLHAVWRAHYPNPSQAHRHKMHNSVIHSNCPGNDVPFQK